jgi:hypothetical protein
MRVGLIEMSAGTRLTAILNTDLRVRTYRKQYSFRVLSLNRLVGDNILKFQAAAQSKCVN